MAARKERPIAATWITFSGCEGNCWQVHESGWRIIRAMPMLGDPVWLRVQLRRVRCSECGTSAERVLWLDRHARITRRLADFVGLWCEKLPVAVPDPVGDG